jgi:hypothetical protein
MKKFEQKKNQAASGTNLGHIDAHLYMENGIIY